MKARVGDRAGQSDCPSIRVSGAAASVVARTLGNCSWLFCSKYRMLVKGGRFGATEDRGLDFSSDMYQLCDRQRMS